MPFTIMITDTGAVSVSDAISRKALLETENALLSTTPTMVRHRHAKADGRRALGGPLLLNASGMGSYTHTRRRWQVGWQLPMCGIYSIRAAFTSLLSCNKNGPSLVTWQTRGGPQSVYAFDLCHNTFDSACFTLSSLPPHLHLNFHQTEWVTGILLMLLNARQLPPWGRGLPTPCPGQNYCPVSSAVLYACVPPCCPAQLLSLNSASLGCLTATAPLAADVDH
jgi:hypothetical protein